MRIILLLVAMLFLWPAPKAAAMDPVTLAILAPMALKAAEAAKPYLIKGAINFGKGLLKVGRDVCQLSYFPYGLFKMTVGAPFGGFHSGVVYTIRGGVLAPGRMVVHTLLLPVYAIGINVNI